MRPQPMLPSGALKPVTTLFPDPTTIALSNAAEGANALAGTFAPVGYQPSVRYWRISVAQPAAAGHAIEVPLSAAYVESLVVEETTPLPGATMVGLVRPSAQGPRLENPASVLDDAPLPTAPTLTMFLALPGEPTVAALGPALPLE